LDNSCFVGKDFFSSLLDTELVPTNMTVFVKIAILATQVSCPESKRVDNFSRFVTKGDIQMLKGKKYQGKVVDAEKMLSQCWDNMQANPMATFEKNKVFGRLCLRTTLHLLSKEKSGRDTTEFANLQEIRGCIHRRPEGNASAAPATSLADAFFIQEGRCCVFGRWPKPTLHGQLESTFESWACGLLPQGSPQQDLHHGQQG